VNGIKKEKEGNELTCTAVLKVPYFSIIELGTEIKTF
jgi:hypothetical protein